MVDEAFDDLQYTRREIAGELYEIQKHASNGSAHANCKCIQEKHLLGVRTEAAEGVTIASEPKEKEFYAWLSPWADKTLTNVLEVLDENNEANELAMWSRLADDCREIRHEITNETWTPPNPAVTRAYLPHGLTTTEQEDKMLQTLLSRCIRKVEIKQCPHGFKSYDECKVNPVAVCRASVKK
jgi:hypothetical protein